MDIFTFSLFLQFPLVFEKVRKALIFKSSCDVYSPFYSSIFRNNNDILKYDIVYFSLKTSITSQMR
jgi:hypothetical protein